MKLPITDEMRDSHDIVELAEAFHPTNVWGDHVHAHPSRVIDAIEAALLYGAHRISRVEFMQAIEDLDDWEEMVP
jgi:hypothetical protein